MLYVQVRVIAALMGKGTDIVHKDALRANWRKASRRGVNGNFFCLGDVERTYQLTFSNEQIAAADEAFSKPAVIQIEEQVNV
jgi:hypothetical protein